MTTVNNDLRRPESGSLGQRRPATTVLAAAVAGVLYGLGGSALAADSTAGAAAGSSTLEEVVVTATPQGVKKLDASFNIVTASLDDIKLANPISAADIFKLSPGIWPESSGGQTGVNVDVAGFPNGGGDSPYFTTMIQGSPLYGAPDLSFLDSSSLVRLDDTIERVEIVQGGTSAIYGPGQAGATANFILRTGTDKTSGSLGLTYGFEGMERVDAFLGGKVADGWYASVGGFYRQSDGVRNPQYPSDIGGQFTATLKHTMDNGSLLFWFRTLHDKNQWVADFPYLVCGSSACPYPGFNQLHSTYNSKQLQNFLVPNPAGGWENDDISDGRGADLNYFGSELKLALDHGWSISNNFIFDGGYVNTHALVNNGNPSSLSDFIGTLTLPEGLDPASIQATYANGGIVDPNTSVVTQQVWLVQKKIMSVADEFRLAKDFGNGNTLTLGVYAAHYTDNDNWSLGSNVLINNVPNASPIVLQAAQGSNIWHITSSQGIVSANGGYYIMEQGNATNIAGYVSDAWKLGDWLLDASVRLEHIDLTQQTTNLAPKQLGTQYDLWDNAVELPDGTYSYAHEHNTVPTFSVGANYEFNRNMSAYVRVNNGVFFDNFDAVRCNVYNGSNGCPSNPPLNRIQNYELGFKVQNQWTYLDASVYDKEFQGLVYQPVNIQNVPIGPTTTYGSTAKGIRLIGSVNPFATSDLSALRSFKITVNANYEDAHYKDYLGCFIYTDINNNVVCGAINGVQLARLPKFQYRITPSDTQSFSWGTLTESVTYEHIGQHYQDQTGLNPLGSYYDLAAGISAAVGDNWEFMLVGSNLTNQLGLTEGNARVGGNAVQNSVGFGRSILGREIAVQAKYKF
ncbi:MAG: TonB-dependent receptor [Proteobacteria bacterium]|nr:TonB-dependent receptor [Pseudomonadota bacterium]